MCENLVRVPVVHRPPPLRQWIVIGAVGKPENPPIQTVVMLGHKLFAPVPLVLELHWLTAFNHSSRSRCVPTNRLPVGRASLEISFAIHPFRLWQGPPIFPPWRNQAFLPRNCGVKLADSDEGLGNLRCRANVRKTPHLPILSEIAAEIGQAWRHEPLGLDVAGLGVRGSLELGTAARPGPASGHGQEVRALTTRARSPT